MAKIEKLVTQAQLHLNAGERVSAAVMGSYEAKVLGTDSVRSGVMLATDQRVVFYARKLGGYDLESLHLWQYLLVRAVQDDDGLPIISFRIGEQSHTQMDRRTNCF